MQASKRKSRGEEEPPSSKKKKVSKKGESPPPKYPASERPRRHVYKVSPHQLNRGLGAWRKASPSSVAVQCNMARGKFRGKGRVWPWEEAPLCLAQASRDSTWTLWARDCRHGSVAERQLHTQILGANQLKVLRKVTRGEGQAKDNLTKFLKDGEVYL